MQRIVGGERGTTESFDFALLDLNLPDGEAWTCSGNKIFHPAP